MSFREKYFFNACSNTCICKCCGVDTESVGVSFWSSFLENNRCNICEILQRFEELHQEQSVCIFDCVPQIITCKSCKWVCNNAKIGVTIFEEICPFFIEIGVALLLNDLLAGVFSHSQQGLCQFGLTVLRFEFDVSVVWGSSAALSIREFWLRLHEAVKVS